MCTFEIRDKGTQKKCEYYDKENECCMYYSKGAEYVPEYLLDVGGFLGCVAQDPEICWPKEEK